MLVDLLKYREKEEIDFLFVKAFDFWKMLATKAI